MFNFGTPHNHKTCAVILEVGSGSVGVAIVLSDPLEDSPKIIWTSREYLPIKDISSMEIPLQEITTSIINIFLQVGSAGIKALREYDPSHTIDAIQVSISAPWSYTVSRTINFSDEHPFEVNEELLDELSNTAAKQAVSETLENTIIKENNLEIIHNQTIRTVINGYPIQLPHNVTTREVSLTHVISITQKKISEVVQDSASKILPTATISLDSYMSRYYQMMYATKADTAEACLVHITSEATEIGIIRENILTHVTHTAFGTFSIAREIAAVGNIPKEEAYSYIKDSDRLEKSNLSSAKQAEIQTIITAYETKIATLFIQTGDALAIPKTIFMHTEQSTEDFFAKRIAHASKKSTGIEHAIHPVTSELFPSVETNNTALSLTATLYHIHNSSNAT